uniref:Uncharacterized protein n=1 Tax=Romanomermis culicivorax TaxID=13658 RepID=A0A915JFM9_ROMCU
KAEVDALKSLNIDALFQFSETVVKCDAPKATVRITKAATMGSYFSDSFVPPVYKKGRLKLYKLRALLNVTGAGSTIGRPSSVLNFSNSKISLVDSILRKHLRLTSILHFPLFMDIFQGLNESNRKGNQSRSANQDPETCKN